MGRPRLNGHALTGAERWHRHAAGRKAAGGKPTRGKAASLFDTARFIAIDGEGFSEGDAEEFHIGERVYKCQPHYYALLSASDGAEIYAESGRLSTQQCLDFLIDRAEDNAPCILICFGGSYDFCQMLMHGLSRDDLDVLWNGYGGKFRRKYLDVSLGQYDYRLELRMRKSLTVKRWPRGADKYQRHVKKDGSRIWRMTKCQSATLWDAWGYFQSSFVNAMATWIPDDPDYQMIQAKKGERDIFDRNEIADIRIYNQAEVRCLAAIMDRVRGAIEAMGLKTSRWDGAGAIAAAIIRLHDVKAHMADSPDDVFTAARHAYSGGHIEVYKLGYHNGKVYHYDINSAYPHQFRNLPSLSGGNWIKGNGPPSEGFTLVRVEYRFKPGLPFYPFFYRETNGTILYPERGAGWYWYPEFDAGQQFTNRFGAIEFNVVEWWHFQPFANDKPFRWIEEYYERRAFLIAESKRSGIPNGEEKTLKLGYNSCYGKTAQQVGARIEGNEIIPPPYFQLEWAGYVTAGCRAQIMLAAMQKPDCIIGLATDGIFSIEPLDLYCPPAKELGAWECQIHDGITMVMPGVYWLHDGAETKHFSRGFNKRDMRDPQIIHRAWARKESSIDVTLRRLITLGSALSSDTLWEMRGRFVDSARTLKINGDNSKRYEAPLYKAKPHKGLVDTKPRDLWEDYAQSLSSLMSAPYPIAWLDMDEPQLEQRGEDDDDTLFDDDVFASFMA
jgi:hypothetical protein